ncbi:Uncharacterized protein pbN1_07030 [Aromatoleum bremense]|nr:Uncharacterized protein pbN1_07030 [Aromatoleum bremense]
MSPGSRGIRTGPGSEHVVVVLKSPQLSVKSARIDATFYQRKLRRIAIE